MIDLQNIQIENALEPDCDVLTQIAFAAKKHWKYPEEYYDLWKNELTITSDYIRQNLVFVAKYKQSITGFYSIIENKKDFYSGDIFIQKGFWMEHIFIYPEFHNRGIGTMLIRHLKHFSKENNISRMLIFVDPFAKGFYEKMGADYLYESKSSIPGRLIPVYEMKI